MKDFSELKELIEINSYTKNIDGVNKNGKLYIKKFEELGFKTTIFDRSKAGFGNHLLFESKKKEGKKLLLLGHIDTVFPPGTFEGFREDDEWIYGPGVCDMKGGNMVMIEALRNVAKNKKIKNVDVFLVSDEEIGSDDSFQFTKKLGSSYDYCLVFEAAGKNAEIVTGRKGVGTYYIDIEGKAAHAGNHYDEGINANLEAAYKLISLTDLTNLKEGTTVNVGKIEGGIGANTISPKAHLSVEVRFTKKKERDRVLNSLHEIVHKPFSQGTKATLSGRLQRDVMEENEKQLKFIAQIEKWIGKKLKTEKRGGGSDANIVASSGCITIDGFGPYGDGDHTINERALKKSYFERIEEVTKILEGFIQN